MKTFNESQKFKQWWIWLILVSGVGLAWFYKFKEPESAWEISLIIVHLVVVLFLVMELDTRIDEAGIHYRFFPFQWKHKLIKWDELEKVYVRKYKPIYEYGGWGIRGLGRDMAFNVSGNMGLQLEMKDGDRFLIGTQKPKEMEEVILFYTTKT